MIGNIKLYVNDEIISMKGFSSTLHRKEIIHDWYKLYRLEPLTKTKLIYIEISIYVYERPQTTEEKIRIENFLRNGVETNLPLLM